MKKLFTIALVLFLSLITITTANAANATTKVNVRSGPSTDSVRLGKVNNGDRVTELAIYDDTWALIAWEDGVAFIAREYLAGETELPQVTMIGVVNTKSGTLNVRSTPELVDSNIVAKVNKGTVVYVTNSYADEAWLSVITKDGTSGLIAREYLKTSERIIEVDIHRQCVNVYGNYGRSLYISDGVTTGTNSMPTPVGIYSIQEKAENQYLGENKTYVRWWMQFNGGYGLHDATWNKTFGSESYRVKHGSHGCVRLALSTAETVYRFVSVGDLVVIH